MLENLAGTLLRNVRRMQNNLANNSFTGIRSIHLAPNEDKPASLEKWWDTLTLDEKKEAAELTWLSQGSSIKHAGYGWWISIFREIGFLTNCDASRPTKDTRLYRGCRPELHRGMPWTTDPIAAKIFASRGTNTGTKRVYTTVAPPDAVLAIFDGKVDSSHMEGMPDIMFVREYVLDCTRINPDLVEEYKG